MICAAKRVHADMHGVHARTTCPSLIAAAPAKGNRRLIQRVAVRPHACYRLSAWVKTEGLTNTGADGGGPNVG